MLVTLYTNHDTSLLTKGLTQHAKVPVLKSLTVLNNYHSAFLDTLLGGLREDDKESSGNDPDQTVNNSI